MFQEALVFLADQAQAAAKADVQQHGHYLLITGPDGSVRTESPPRPPSNAKVLCLESLAARINAEEDASSTVWVGHKAITAVLLDVPDIGTVTLPLVQSRPLNALVHGATAMDQPAFCRWLQMSLDVPAETVAPFRKLNWSAGANAAGQVQHGKESLGREVYAHLTNAEDVGTTLVLQIPLYDCLGQRDRYAIRCHVDIDTAKQTLRLDPAPGEILTALDAHAQKNADTLRDLVNEGNHVYLGDPGTWVE